DPRAEVRRRVDDGHADVRRRLVDVDVVDLLLAVLHGRLVETEDAVDGERIRRPAVRLRAVVALRRRSRLHGLELDGLRTRELRARHGEAVRDPTHDAAIAE